MKPEIGITEKHLDTTISVLGVILADEMMLYVKTRKSHWNVIGNSFMELHKLFEGQYSEQEKTIDLVAERISKLGGKAIGTMKEFLEHTRLNEKPAQFPSQKVMMQELLADHESLVVGLRRDIEICGEDGKDAVTADLLTKIMEQHESTAWVLRRYLS